MSEKYRDTDYLHISARIKMLETKLIGRDVFEKAAEAESITEAVRIIADSGFGEGAEISDEKPNYEELIAREQANVYEFLSASIPDKRLIDIFALRYDYMNIKALIKAEILGVSSEGLLVSGGTISKPALTEAFRERDGRVLSPTMLKAVTESLDSMAESDDPQNIDLICDRLCYSEILSLCASSGYGFLTEYMIKKVDLINILTYLRCRAMNKNRAFFEKAFIFAKGGLDSEFFSELYESPLTQFYDALSKTVYSVVLDSISGDAFSLYDFEKACKTIESTLLSELKYIAFGPQVVFAYLLTKEAEMKNVRTVLVGRSAGLDAEAVKERLRLDYV